MSTNDKVAIILATYNGAKYLEDQLISLLDQTHKNWDLYIRDDGSTDRTLEIIDYFKNNNPEKKVVVNTGKRLGFVKNFMSLLASEEIVADYYALCDQDDVWLPEKLERALAVLSARGEKRYDLYCSRVIYTDGNLETLGVSEVFSGPKNFKNAIVQNVAGGNTFVLTATARKLVSRTLEADVPFHDWWIYLLITGSGGEVFYDEASYIYYRQHQAAIVSGSLGLKKRFERVIKMLQGQIANWNDRHQEALKRYEYLLTADAINVKNIYFSIRNKNILRRIFLLNSSNVYRQTIRGMFSLYLSCALNKL